MTSAQQQAMDRRMMRHCIALSQQSGKAGEYPYAAVVCRDGAIVAESINRVTHDGDVTRHAEVVTISLAQKALRCVSLDRGLRYVSEKRQFKHSSNAPILGEKKQSGNNSRSIINEIPFAF